MRWNEELKKEGKLRLREKISKCFLKDLLQQFFEKFSRSIRKHFWRYNDLGGIQRPAYSDYSDSIHDREPSENKNFDHKSTAAGRSPKIRWKVPLLFYLLTWISTTVIGVLIYGRNTISGGLLFSVPLMTILTCHELGHFLQARRYGVHATFPYFIPVPFPPFGTLGAVIQMDRNIPNLRALFDIGISGPLAGLVPTLIFLILGMSLSSLEPIPEDRNVLIFGEPLLLDWVSRLFLDRSDPAMSLYLHPIGMAAWTGLFITTLNLFPLGQLDGGHVLYALLNKKAPYAALAIFSAIILYVLLFQQWQWLLMVTLMMIFGINHPPTCNDALSLDRKRKILGWLTLAFVLIGFTPNPISESENIDKLSQCTPQTTLLIKEENRIHLQ